MQYLATACVALMAVGSASALPELFGRATCNRDNCFRAVAASAAAPGSASASADCASFLLLTVTQAPATTIATEFATSTSTVTVGNYAAANGKRDAEADIEERSAPPLTPTTSYTTITATRVPTYASACSGSVRYSSACSCNGITAVRTTTLAQVTVTSTTTVAPTATVRAVYQIQDPSSTANYVHGGGSSTGSGKLIIGPDGTPGTFYVDSNGGLHQVGVPGVAFGSFFYSGQAGLVQFNTGGAGSGDTTIIASVSYPQISFNTAQGSDVICYYTANQEPLYLYNPSTNQCTLPNANSLTLVPAGTIPFVAPL